MTITLLSVTLGDNFWVNIAFLASARCLNFVNMFVCLGRVLYTCLRYCECSRKLHCVVRFIVVVKVTACLFVFTGIRWISVVWMSIFEQKKIFFWFFEMMFSFLADYFWHGFGWFCDIFAYVRCWYAHIYDFCDRGWWSCMLSVYLSLPNDYNAFISDTWG